MGGFFHVRVFPGEREATPYSSSRIKELTMNKVSMNKPRKHIRPLRFLAVAAIISTLTVSALAVGHVLGAGALLQNFFAEKNGSLSDGQIQVIDQMGKTFENGVTSNGTTITPIAGRLCEIRKSSNLARSQLTFWGYVYFV